MNDNIEKIDFNFKNEAYAWWRNKYDKLPTEYHKHFIVTFSSFMYSLNKSKYNEYDLNIWDIRNLGLKINQKPTKEIYRLDFTFLKYDGFIKPVKEYIYKCIKSYEKITTTKVRLLSLRLFIKILIDEGLYDFLNLERKYIKKYITELRKKGDCVYTQNKRLRNVNFLIQFLIDNGYIKDSNYITTDDFFSEPKKNKFVKFSPKVVEAINKAIKLLSPNEQRMIYLLKSTGLRPIDIDTLLIEDFKKLPDSDDYYLEIKQQKQNSFRTRVLSKNEVELIKEAIAQSKKDYGDDCKYIFQYKKRCLEAENVCIKLNRRLKELGFCDENGVQIHVSSYDFRKNLASTLAASNFTPLQVGYMLGHKNLQSLHYYLEIEAEKSYDEVIAFLETLDNLNKRTSEKKAQNKGKRIIAGKCNLPEGVKCESGNKCLGCPLFRENTLDEAITQVELQIEDVKIELEMADLNKVSTIKEYYLELLTKLERKKASLLATCN